MKFDVLISFLEGPWMHPPAGNTTVLLVDDQPFMREGIRRVLEDYKDVHVVAEAKDGLEAIQYARMLKPHVVLMDISLPMMNGVEAARVITQEDPETIIVGLSIQELDTMPQAIHYAGFTTYLNKDCIVEDLYPTITRCLSGSNLTD
jgi:DNA-binding NarL/FixJ family response regulator